MLDVTANDLQAKMAKNSESIRESGIKPPSTINFVDFSRNSDSGQESDIPPDLFKVVPAIRRKLRGGQGRLEPTNETLSEIAASYKFPPGVQRGRPNLEAEEAAGPGKFVNTMPIE